MATITRENIGLLNEKIVVKVEKDDYLPSFQKAIKDYSKKANIPGFRKGMVPVGMVKKMYGSSVFADEVIKSVEKGLSEYMANEKLQIFAQPLPLPENDSRKLDMNQPDEYQFSFEVGLKPEFTLTDLSSAHFTLYKVEVTDDIIDSEISRMGKKRSQEAIDNEENELDVTLIETDSEGNDKEGGLSKDISLRLDDFVPEIRNDLMGKKKDDTLNIQLSTAFTEKSREDILKELAFFTDNEETASRFFKLLIREVFVLEKPELNESFFKSVYPNKDITTEQAFKDELKKEMEGQWTTASHTQLQDQIYHELLHTHIEFPEDFLKRWMQTGGNKSKSAEEVNAEYPSFVNQLKWTLISEKIADENNIEIKPEDFRLFAKNQLFSYMGRRNVIDDIDQPWINDYVDRMMKDKKFVEDNYYRLRGEKIMAWAETQIHPTEVAISEDDFSKLLREHTHEH